MPEKKKRNPEPSTIVARDILIAIVTLLIPQGWSMSGFPPNIIGACICWLVAGLFLAHALWTYRRLPKWIRGVAISVGIVGAILFLWNPVLAEYQKEYARPLSQKSMTHSPNGMVGVGVEGKGATFDNVIVDGFGSTEVRVAPGASLNMKGDSSISHGKVGVENNGGQINMEDRASIHDNDKNVVLNAPKKEATVKPPPQP